MRIKRYVERVMAPDEEQQRRMFICKDCDRGTGNTIATWRCTECGCFIRPKSALKNSECPLGKWGKWTQQ